MRRPGKLSALKVARLTKPGLYADGNGLYLQVGARSARSWILRYMIGGRARYMGLGPCSVIGLAEARERATHARLLIYSDSDPIEVRRESRMIAKAEKAKQITFEYAAGRYIESHRAGWKNPKHAAQWQSTLSRYAFPIIGDLCVSAVDLGHVMKILEPIWTTKTETASRVRGRIEKVLGWATTRHYRTGDNPARWNGHLENLLARKEKVSKTKHHEALPYTDIPDFMAELRRLDGLPQADDDRGQDGGNREPGLLDFIPGAPELGGALFVRRRALLELLHFALEFLDPFNTALRVSRYLEI